jgi:hypothetical protein
MKKDIMVVPSMVLGTTRAQVEPGEVSTMPLTQNNQITEAMLVNHGTASAVSIRKLISIY